jgi:hypothetical protein
MVAEAEKLSALGGLEAFIDDYCGTTGPHPPVPPIGWLRDILVGVAISRMARTLENTPLAETLLRSSSELVASGLKRAGSNPMPGLAISVQR